VINKSSKGIPVPVNSQSRDFYLDLSDKYLVTQRKTKTGVEKTLENCKAILSVQFIIFNEIY
jgi:hypothetical protein